MDKRVPKNYLTSLDTNGKACDDPQDEQKRQDER